MLQIHSVGISVIHSHENSGKLGVQKMLVGVHNIQNSLSGRT